MGVEPTVADLQSTTERIDARDITPFGGASSAQSTRVSEVASIPGSHMVARTGERSGEFAELQSLWPRLSLEARGVLLQLARAAVAGADATGKRK